VRQGYAIHKLHAQIDKALFQHNVIISDDVWMVETAGGLGFQHQAFSQAVVVFAAVVHRDGLERYSTANQPVLRLVHHSHRPASQFGLDNVPALKAGSALEALVGSRSMWQSSHETPSQIDLSAKRAAGILQVRLAPWGEPWVV